MKTEFTKVDTKQTFNMESNKTMKELNKRITNWATRSENHSIIYVMMQKESETEVTSFGGIHIPVGEIFHEALLDMLLKDKTFLKYVRLFLTYANLKGKLGDIINAMYED